MSLDDTTGKPLPGHTLVAARLAAGLAQGLALYLLYLATDHKAWPSTNGQIFAPLLFVSFATPIIFNLSMGNLRARTTLLWVLGATALSAFIGWYDIWHGWPTYWANDKYFPNILPTALSMFGTAVLLFIAHALIASGDHDRRLRAHYPTHFDVSWKLCLQLALAFLFFLAFWAVLWLGASLFGLVKLTFFRELLLKEWFFIPVSAAATALALHVTDVRPALVRGARSLVLVLLSWLLPVMALIVIGFLIALVFTGLAPLWQTRSAVVILLFAFAALLTLINATYQDGAPEKPAARIFRLAASAAALALTPLAVLAAYALALRVQQYGWTVERITAAAFTAIALAYAGGYAFAVLAKGAWLARIETWNFIVALFVLATLFAYFSPLADPYRISVSSQLARLATKKVAAEKFDLNYLRWEGGRFGKAALERLSKAAPPSLATRATTALSARTAYAALSNPVELEKNFTVYPKGKTPPASFVKNLSKIVEGFEGPPCLRFEGSKCATVLIDLDKDGRDEILVVAEDGRTNAIYAQNNGWSRAGRFAGVLCPKHLETLKTGGFQLHPPASRYQTLDLGGYTLQFAPQDQNPPCKP